MENMKIYTQLQDTPSEAKKPISAGRLKGFTDINPMWRIKRLTEVFGPCGFGWKYEITKQWSELIGDNSIQAHCNINLYVNIDGKWSEPIPATGGSHLCAIQKGAIYSDDEGYKKALTDAIGVACKALGMSADIYFSQDRTKYTVLDTEKEAKKEAALNNQTTSSVFVETPKELTYEEALEYKIGSRTVREIFHEHQEKRYIEMADEQGKKAMEIVQAEVDKYRANK